MTLDEAYADYDRIEEEFASLLDQSLGPRGPAVLMELVAGLALPAGSSVVDVGCGDGEEALDLVRRFDVRVHGIDPVAASIAEARADAEAAGLAARTHFTVGMAEELPVADASADLVWSKEMLAFVDLDATLAEVSRVLRPGGRALLYQVLTGPRMTDDEARVFWEHDLGYAGARSLRPEQVEDAIARSGLTLDRRIDLGSEWGEAAQQTTGTPGRRLLHAARLLREPERFVERFGETHYRVMLGDCLWHVYRMIGKLHGVAFLVTREDGGPA